MSDTGTIDAAILSHMAISSRQTGRYHAVEGEELERFKKLERPLPLAIASAFAGLFFGTAYQATRAIEIVRAGSGQLELLDVMYLIVCAGAFGVALTTAFIASRGKAEIIKALDAILERPRLPVPPSSLPRLAGHAAV